LHAAQDSPLLTYCIIKQKLNIAPRNKPKMDRPRALIFDIDGLLISSEDAYTDIYTTLLRKLDIGPVPWSIRARKQATGPDETQRMLTAMKCKLTLEQWADARKPLERQFFPQSRVLPGVLDLLERASNDPCNQDLRLAVASSSGRDLLQMKMGHLPQLTAYLDRMCRVFKDDLMRDGRKVPMKPAPDPFLAALDKINASATDPAGPSIKPSECVVFEDSLAGVQAALAAGMRVVWVPHPEVRRVIRGREHWVLDGLAGRDQAKGDELDAWMRSRDEVQLTAEEREDKALLSSSDGRVEMIHSMDEISFKKYGL
jgi:pseudouridine-5'-monophosphatase